MLGIVDAQMRARSIFELEGGVDHRLGS
jgi:hypothetical protein